MSLATTRSLWAPSRLIARRAATRNASTTSEVATKAKETTQQATSKASEGLSKVSSSASSAASSATETASNAAGRAQGMVGRTVSFVNSLVPPTMYAGRVGLELGRIIFESRKMSPPSLQTFQKYMQPMMNVVRNPSSMFSQASKAATSMENAVSQPQNMLNRMRNITTSEMFQVGVVTAEVVGFFTVGEMLGRLKLIGYRGGKAAGEHH